MAKRRRGRDPETTTGARWTNIANARAEARCAVGDRVAWDEGDAILLGVVEGFVESDPCSVRVRLEDGSAAAWPTVSPRFRRVPKPLPPVDYTSGSVVTQIPTNVAGQTPTGDKLTPIGEPVNPSGYYETVDLLDGVPAPDPPDEPDEEPEPLTIADLTESTMPDNARRRKW